MCEKLAYLICFVFVLSLAGNAEAGLVAHYKLDETTGTIAADSSGNGFDGTITGSTSWAAGKIDGALQLSGDGVTLPASGMGMTSNSGSVAFWMNAGTPSGINTMFWAGDNTTGGGFGTENELHVHIESATANIWTGGELSFYIYNPTVHLHSDPTKGAAGNVPVNPILLSDEQWHHVAAAWGGGSMKLYIDGVLITQASYAPANFVMNNIFLGRMANNSRLFTGLLDDVQIYNHALSDAEVLAAMSGGAPLGFAGKPKPADKAQDVFSGTILSWKPGYYAAEGGTHNVFIGTDINDVNNATIEQPLNVITAEGLDVNNFDPGALEFGATYYWRVDEVNSPSKPGQYKGDIWQFTVEPSALKIPAENITVSSLGAGVGSDPNQTINESGLNPENMDLHSKVAGYMWISTGDVNDVWIRYDFDRVYKLDEMLVWNYNSQFLLKVGFKDVTVEYSEDGQTWKALADVPEFAQGTGKESYLYNTVVDFNGAAAQSVRLTANSNWSNGTITKVGLSEVRFMYIPVWAKEPYPANESINVPLDVTLSWRAGREAAEHKVYLSQDEQSVADGTTAVNTVSQPDRGPLSLDINRTYYWRVDEVNNTEIPSVWAGDIWSFSTPSNILIDGFEVGYDNTDANAVWNTWIDGYGNESVNGCLIGYDFPGPYLSTTNHSGGHSVPFRYNNTTAGYSEATAQVIDLPIGTTDWRTGNPDTLVIWFLGDVNNAFTDRLYAKLNSKKVVYNGAVTDINSPSWVKWKIDLSSFGISLNNVSSITIGVERVGTTGSSGILYIDDIGLTRQVESTDPGTANLTHSYTFENGTANDSVGSAHGTLVGGASIAGGALVTTAQDQWMTMPGSVLALNTYEEITIESWYTPASGANTGYSMLAYFGETVGTSGRNFIFVQPARVTNTTRVSISTNSTGAESEASGPEYDDGRLHHVAVTIDAAKIKLYLDGDLIAASALSAENRISGVSQSLAFLCKSGYTSDPEWIGKIHEFNIYNCALTAGEVFYLYKH